MVFNMWRTEKTMVLTYNGEQSSSQVFSLMPTMTLKELQPQLLALSLEEKAKAIQILAASLSNGLIGIEKTSGVMRGDACIRQTRIPVWLLVSLCQQGASEAYLLEDYPTLTAADLVNAWLYAETHPEEIEAAIARQEAA
jgi:uncharacterized protein (DUF433 family)